MKIRISNSGKTFFLKKILQLFFCFRITGVDGTVLIDGAERELNSFRKMSCYIQQDDRLQTLLTTWENMKIAADLKLGVDVKTSAKEEIVRFVYKRH